MTNFLLVANNEKIKIIGKGSINIFQNITIDNVYLVENCNVNLISISQLTTSLKYKVIFDFNNVIFQDPVTKMMIGEGSLEDGLYFIKNNHFALNVLKEEDMSSIWHKRIGHLSDKVLKKLFNFFHSDHSNCEACKFATQSKIPFCNSFSKTSEILELIHSDVWSPAPITSYNGFKYFVIFIDDFP